MHAIYGDLRKVPDGRRFAPGLAPQSQKQQQSAAQAPEQHGTRLWNLMERLLNLIHSNKASVWRNHSKGNVFGYIQDRLGRINNEIVTWHCLCRWIAGIRSEEHTSELQSL